MRCSWLVVLAALLSCTVEPNNTPTLDSGIQTDAELVQDSGDRVVDSGVGVLDSGSVDSGLVVDTGTIVVTRDAGSDACEGENPAQCTSDNECLGDQICDRSGCRPSTCDCVNGQWRCTPDCGGGICRDPDQGGCEGENPQGCAHDADCGEGFLCNSASCAPSRCSCSGGDSWMCTRDCGGGRCLGQEGFCNGVAAPSGCFQFGCPEGQRCAIPVGGCAGSSCFCEQGEWVCSEDCGGGGECRPL